MLIDNGEKCDQSISFYSLNSLNLWSTEKVYMLLTIRCFPATSTLSIEFSACATLTSRKSQSISMLPHRIGKNPIRDFIFRSLPADLSLDQAFRGGLLGKPRCLAVKSERPVIPFCTEGASRYSILWGCPFLNFNVFFGLNPLPLGLR